MACLQHMSEHDASFLECIRYFENISTADPFVLSLPPNTKGDDNLGLDSDNKDNSPDKKGNGDDDEFLKNMKNYNRSQISFGNLLGVGRSGSVFEAKFYEEIGAFKMVDLYKNEYLVTELLNEIKIYLGPLMDIQEIFIPKLIKFGVLNEAFVFLFVSLAGKSFTELENEVTLKEKKLAILGLQMIHERGVKHGDIRLENIMINRDELTGKTSVWWIDFAWSKMGCDEKDLNKELIKLKHLLGMSD
ncbi:25212_t:CDS:2 [Dentiscutata erythropus]|uniref:25212_t:CDS:1 n=1 Tax=Dentiscutata erythropus TaxID=1348616 RepID=A0A9N9I327_9GLOM|nr:25212_t:CDS:2 [Dentiscutata erythropus]